MLLTANGVSFNWNKHNVMERVRWLPLCLRGGMASKFFHGWKVRVGGGDAKERNRKKEKSRTKTKQFYFTLSLQIEDDRKNCTLLYNERLEIALKGN